MNFRQIQHSAQTAYEELSLPPQVTLELLREYLVAQRHREIAIEELPGLSGTDLCGMWIAMQDRDLILHKPTRSLLYRQQIVFHEFSHMILKHDVDAIPVEPNKTLIPSIDPKMINHVLLRSSFSAESELAAELLADRLSARIMHGPLRLAPEHLSFGEVFG